MVVGDTSAETVGVGRDARGVVNGGGDGCWRRERAECSSTDLVEKGADRRDGEATSGGGLGRRSFSTMVRLWRKVTTGGCERSCELRRGRKVGGEGQRSQRRESS